MALRIARLGAPGRERPALLDEHGTVYDLTPVTEEVNGDFLAADGPARAREAAERGTLRPLEASGQRVGPPVARPGAIVCVGMNYAEHAAETGAAPPEEPVVFFKHPNTVVGPNDDLLLPRGSSRVDWEVELTVVVGRRAHYLGSPDDALACVAGYMVGNDVSERAWQMERGGGQWGKGKSAATFSPLGPWLVPADEVEPQKLHLASWVNGVPRQDSSTADMIFGVAEIVWNVSQYMALDPGDVVMTGTPQGVGLSGRFPFLTDGDVVEVEIEGLGRQRQVCRSA